MSELYSQDSIVRDCLLGSRQAEKLLFEKNYAKMLGVCSRYAVDDDQAKDYVQEGFIKVFKSLKKYNGEGSLEGWIRRIMVNTCIDSIRREKRDRFISEGEHYIEVHASEMEQEEQESDPINPQVLIDSIRELSPAYATVFNLYVVEGYTHKEIAAMLKISEGTSKSNLAKAKKNLKKYLENSRDNKYESI